MWQLFPAYLKKWCKVYERLTWSKGIINGWLGVACNAAPRYPNNHIWKEKVTHNHNWRAERNIAHNPSWQEHLRFTDFLFWEMLIPDLGWVSQFRFIVICFQMSEQKITGYGLASIYAWPNGTVPKLSALFYTSRYWDPEKVGCQGFAGNQSNANRVINKKYDWYLESDWSFNLNSRKSRK